MFANRCFDPATGLLAFDLFNSTAFAATSFLV
jgi:hypothetical protein